MHTTPSRTYSVADIANVMQEAGRLRGGDPESVRHALRAHGIGSVADLVRVLDDETNVQRLKAAADAMHRNTTTTSTMTTTEFATTLRALFLQVATDI